MSLSITPRPDKPKRSPLGIILLCILGVGILFWVSITAQNANQAHHVAAEETATILQTRLDTLELRVSSLEKADVAVQQDLANTKAEEQSLWGKVAVIQYADTSVSIDVTKPVYSYLKTNVGMLLVACTGIEPYLNGEKVHLQIGNPLWASFRGFTLNTTTGNVSSFGGLDLKSTKYGHYDFTETLQPGRWTNISFVVSPATPNDMTYLSANIVLDTVELGVAPNN